MDTQSLLSKYRYEPSTGQFRRNSHTPDRGVIKNVKGYIRVFVGRKYYMAHHITPRTEVIAAKVPIGKWSWLCGRTTNRNYWQCVASWNQAQPALQSIPRPGQALGPSHRPVGAAPIKQRAQQPSLDLPGATTHRMCGGCSRPM